MEENAAPSKTTMSGTISLFSSRSTLAIYPLPNELFVLIAQEVRKLPTVYVYVHSRGTPRPWGWIVLTHFCRCWRHVFINEAHLWTNIDITRKNASAFINRSASALISMSFNNHEDGSPELFDSFVAVLQREAHRTKCLSVDLDGPEIMKDQLENRLLLCPFPEMEEINLHLVGGPQFPMTWRPVVRQERCRMRELTLHGVYIPFDVPVCRDLCHLEL